MSRDYRSEFREAIRGRSRNTLLLGELAFSLAGTPDGSYGQLREVLIAEDGVDAPDESTISRYRRVWEYWRVAHSVPLDQLEARGVSKLYLLATHCESTGANPLELLEATKGLSKRELEASLKGEEPEGQGWPWKQERAIREAFETGARRLYAINDYAGFSLTPAFEFATVLLAELPEATLRQLWREAHGEGQ